MILTIDVGNTNVVLGCVEDGVVVSRSRLATNTSDLPNDYAMKMRQSFAFDSIDYHEFEGAILSSVVPQVNRAIRSAVRKLTGLECIIVGAGIKTGVNVKIDDPGTLAGDLITGTVGALSMYKPPIIIVDMGTATTIVAVDKAGAYIGGAIVPGVNLSFEALSQGTSLLPNISIEAPRKCIATNTVDSMKSGAVFGTAAMIDGMIERMEAELGQPATVIATGGLSGGIIPYCKHEIKHEPDLLLKGLAILYQKNAKPKNRTDNQKSSDFRRIFRYSSSIMSRISSSVSRMPSRASWPTDSMVFSTSSLSIPSPPCRALPFS